MGPLVDVTEQKRLNDAREEHIPWKKHQSQCYVRVPLQDLGASSLRFDDLMGGGRFDREKTDLDARGLYLDVPAWGYHVFNVTVLE